MGAMTHLYSVVCVSDREAALEWYKSFFGRPPDEMVGVEALWQVGSTAWLVIDDRPVRAAGVGHAQVTLAVEGLDEILARFAAHEIEHEPVETYGNGVRHVVIRDPDGNALSLAEAPG